jgi:hypothetical protein
MEVKLGDDERKQIIDKRLQPGSVRKHCLAVEISLRDLSVPKEFPFQLSKFRELIVDFREPFQEPGDPAPIEPSTDFRIITRDSERQQIGFFTIDVASGKLGTASLVREDGANFDFYNFESAQKNIYDSSTDTFSSTPITRVEEALIMTAVDLLISRLKEAREHVSSKRDETI